MQQSIASDAQDFENDFDDDIPQMLSNLSKDAGGANGHAEDNKKPESNEPSPRDKDGNSSSDNSSDDDEDSIKGRASSTAPRWERNVRTSAGGAPVVVSSSGGATATAVNPALAALASAEKHIVPPSPATAGIIAALHGQASASGIGWFNLKAPEWQALSTFAWIPKKRGETLPAALGQHLKSLKALAAEEDWGDHDYVLINYLVHTFYHAQKQGKLIPFEHKEQGGQWYCFNTGLITPNFQSIYAFFMPNRQYNGLILKDYLHRYHAVKRLFPLPKRVKYYNGITDLIFDRSKRLVVDYDHIILDNWTRLSNVLFPGENPEETQNEKNLHQTRILLKGAVKDAKRRCESNYRTAVPQMYGDKLQLLLPLCFANKNRADLALTVARKDYNPAVENDFYYEAATMLDMRMAYNNARLIAKPERDWLIHPDTPSSDVSTSITSTTASSNPASATATVPSNPTSAVSSPAVPEQRPAYHANRRASMPASSLIKEQAAQAAAAQAASSGGPSNAPPGLGNPSSSNASGGNGGMLARPPPGFATPSFRASPLSVLRGEYRPQSGSLTATALSAAATSNTSSASSASTNTSALLPTPTTAPLTAGGDA